MWQIVAFIFCFGLVQSGAKTSFSAVSFAKEKLPSSVVLSSPVTGLDSKTAAICKKVWSFDGFVCKSTEIVNLAIKDHEDMQESEHQFRKVLDVFKEVETLLVEKVPHFSNSVTDNRFKQYLNSTKLAEHKVNSDKCWEHMSKLRNASLCYLCSAVNYKYFFQNKGLVQMEDCSAMLNVCSPHFSIFASFLVLFNGISSHFAQHNLDSKFTAAFDQSAFFGADWGSYCSTTTLQLQLQATLKKRRSVSSPSRSPASL